MKNLIYFMFFIFQIVLLLFYKDLDIYIVLICLIKVFLVILEILIYLMILELYIEIILNFNILKIYYGEFVYDYYFFNFKKIKLFLFKI